MNKPKKEDYIRVLDHFKAKGYTVVTAETRTRKAMVRKLVDYGISNATATLWVHEASDCKTCGCCN